MSLAAGTLSPDPCLRETALTRAVCTGQADLVRRLLECGASPLEANGRDESPLLLGNYVHSPPDRALELNQVTYPHLPWWPAAVLHTDVGQIFWRSSLIFSSSVKNESGWSHLEGSVTHNPSELSFPSLSFSLRTSLHPSVAVRGGSYEISHALLAYGAWVEQPSPFRRWTAVHEAARGGHADVLMLLLRSGVGGGAGVVDQRDAMGSTPLAVAAEHGHLHAAEVLLHCGQSAGTPDRDPLPPFLPLTLSAPPPPGSRVNAQTCSGESVLMGGAGSGSSALVRLLLEHGAQPDLASSAGQLPIHRAAARGHLR